MWAEFAAVSVLGAALCLPCVPTRNDSAQTVQYRSEEQPSIGNILVANENLADPNFAQSVVLIVQYEEDDGTAGIIINRRTEIPLSRIFPNTKHATADPVYMGGPVATAAVQALLALSGKTDQATHVMGNIWVTGAKELIEKSIMSRMDPSKLRLYLGYAAWAPGQLEAEIRLGAWSVLNSSPKIVFDKDPDSLWSRLTQESHMQTAFALTPNPSSVIP